MPIDLDTLFQQAIHFHQSQQWSSAIDNYTKVLQLQANHLGAQINLGAVHRKLNQFEAARRCYQKALEYEPNSIEAWFNFGNLCIQIRDWCEADACFSQLTRIKPDHSAAYLQWSRATREQQNWTKTVDLLNKALRFEPNSSAIHLEMGNAQRRLGQMEEALSHYQKTVLLEPESWRGHYSLARMYDPNDPQLFSKHFKTALRHCPDPSQLHASLAETRFDEGNNQGAAEQYRLALKANHQLIHAHLGLGKALIHLKQQTSALQHFDQVSQSTDIVLLSKLADAFWNFKMIEQGIQVLEKIVSIDPKFHETHMNLAKAYAQSWKLSAALDCIQKTLELMPDFSPAIELKASIYIKQGHCQQALAVFSEQEQQGTEASPPQIISAYLFTLLYSDAHTATEKADIHMAMANKWFSAPPQEQSLTNDLTHDRKLKVGYISADLHYQHPVGIFVKPLLEQHRQDQFEITIYHNSRLYDESSAQIRKLAPHWREVEPWTNERLARQIRNDNIDILIDLSGHTGNHRLHLFSGRVAPIQMTWLGYPHSTGLKNMDYLIGDEVVCPIEHDSLNSEHVLRLKQHSVFCFPPNRDYGDSDMSKAKSRWASNDKIVFASFNNLTKSNPYTLNLWVQILNRVTHSKLKIRTPSFTDVNCRSHTLEYFTSRGINEDRLEFTGPCSMPEMMRDYKNVDIGLDPMPFNGGTTSMQALWMGVPIVTKRGENFCSRMGASFMQHLGLNEWIAKSDEDYISIAIAMAEDRPELLALKQDLRQLMEQSPLCDTQGFTDEMEQLYRQAWQDYCADPQHSDSQKR